MASAPRVEPYCLEREVYRKDGHFLSVQDIIQDVAGIATALGIPVAIAGGIIAVRSLRTQAGAQRLEAILATNVQWQEIGKSTSTPFTLSTDAIMAIRRVYAELNYEPAMSATVTGKPASPLALSIPFITASFFPVGNTDRNAAPNAEEAYITEVRARTLVYGYVRTVLATEKLSPWMSPATREEIRDQFDRLDRAMEQWVNKINEIAELYENELIDRQLFVRKRSVVIIQQLFAAEPYILWRNCTDLQRWGLRVLSLGAEARMYHWYLYLQHAGYPHFHRAAIKLRVDPDGYGPTDSYDGFCNSAGWILGARITAGNMSHMKPSERKLRRRLGLGFSEPNKKLQNDVIESLPRDSESGLPAGPFDWLDTARKDDPVKLRSAISSLTGTVQPKIGKYLDDAPRTELSASNARAGYAHLSVLVIGVQYV